MFKCLSLGSWGHIDRLGASDVDNVGVQDVRKDCEAHLFERAVQLEQGFDLLFNHWDEVDRWLRWVSVWIRGSNPRVIYARPAHVRSH